MIAQYKDRLAELKVQFEKYLEPLLPELHEVAEYVQAAQADDDQLSDHSGRLSSFLARVNGIYGEMEGFRTQFTALATEWAFNSNPEMGANAAKAIAGRHTSQCEQVYKTVDRLSATITHQLTNINARIWKAREEMKLAGQNNQPRKS